MKPKQAFILVAVLSTIFLVGMAATVYYVFHVPIWIIAVVAALLVASLVVEDTLLPKKKLYYHDDALRPRIPEKLLQSSPVSNSVVFGVDKYSGKYVMKEPSQIAHTMVFGQTGSSKTASVVLPSILSCTSGSKQILDIKSRELVIKSADLKNPLTYIVDINRSDEFCYGWDVFYKLKEAGPNPEEHAVLQVLEQISPVIISSDAKTSDPFWTSGARNLFTGLCLYEYVYAKRRNIVDIIEITLATPLREHLEIALNTVRTDSLVAKFLNAYRDCAEETLMSVQITMTQPLYIFLQKDVSYAFRENPRKADPTLLEKEGVSMYLCVDETRLDAGYDKLVQIILKQTLYEIQLRSGEYKGAITNLYWDEFGRCSDSCEDVVKTTASFLKTARSRATNVTLVSQSADSFDKRLLYDILANITYLLILNCSNANSLTAEIVTKMVGSYYEKTRSYTSSSGKNRSSTTSFQEKAVLKPDDLNTLGDEAILLVSNMGYFRTDKSKSAYYKYEPFKSVYHERYAVNSRLLPE